MTVEKFPTWGRNPEYDNLVAVLLANQSEGLPLPEFWMLEKNEQRVAIAVCEATGMTPGEWKQLTLPERVPWLEKTIKSIEAVGTATKAPATDGTVWQKQAEVARRLKYNKMKISRLCNDGTLRTNGKNGRECRVDRDSVIEYCHREGIAYNET